MKILTKYGEVKENELPEALKDYKIPFAKNFYTEVSEGRYLLQNIYSHPVSAFFLTLLPKEKDTVIITKETNSYYLIIQVENSFHYHFDNYIDNDIKKKQCTNGGVTFFAGILQLLK